MALTYTLYVQEAAPEKIAPGTLWLKKSIGLVMLWMNDEFIHWSAGNGNLSITDGVYYKQVTSSTTAPTSPDMGDIWLQNDKSFWMYLGDWFPFGGG